MAALALDFSLPLRDFELTSRSTSRGPSRSSARPARARRRRCASWPGSRGRVAVVALGDDVWLDETVDRPPEERRVGLVFQDIRTVPASERSRSNVGYAGARSVDAGCSSGFGSRTSRMRARPGISGGERQRVALARALAREPAVLPCSTSRSLRLDRAHETGSAAWNCTNSCGNSPSHASGHAAPTRTRPPSPTRSAVLIRQHLNASLSADRPRGAPRDGFVASLNGANLLHGTAHPLES